MAYGYVLACRKSDVIALHDCDILSYDRELLARLCYPVANPNINFEFCKGYYARVTDRMHGRVTRLLVTPLIRSMQRILGYQPLLVFMDSFRYPLAGEFAMDADLARVNRIPGDWGLEVGVLAEVHRNCSVKRVCQSELCATYEHKHQDLSAGDPSKGLMKMAVDICKTLFRNLSAEGADAEFRSVPDPAVLLCPDGGGHHHPLPGRCPDRRARSSTGTARKWPWRPSPGRSGLASEAYLEDPLGQPLIPNWNRIIAALPGFLEELEDAVELDNR